MEKLNIFFEQIKIISFWQRIFSWGKIRASSYDAYQEYLQFKGHLEKMEADLVLLNSKYIDSSHEKDRLNDSLAASEKTLFKSDSENQRLSARVEDLNREVTKLQSVEESRILEHRKAVDQMIQAKAGFEAERKELTDQQLKQQEERLEAMKRQWSEHEEAVKSQIKGLCQAHIIQYVDNVPFKGRPDNTVEICGEYIIFDAKSPASDDLTNFPHYIKAQAEAAGKYAKQENVKKDIFLVIPGNIAQCIEQWSYPMGDYDVFLLTPDALEPVLQVLKELEVYEFVDQLTPDERDNICRIIGKFAHTTKRRIQIDQFFSKHAMDLIRRCETELPAEFREAVNEFEKAEKLNPSTEKRTKQILISDLNDQYQAINGEALGRKIPIPDVLEELDALK